MNEIITINGVQCYEENGTAYLNLEAVARGLGFTDSREGTEYVRWARVDKYLAEINFATSGERPKFIPENIFYRLAMKAKNETAEKFQAIVADEIIPSIRKHGGYLTPQKIEEALLNPDTIIRLATDLKAEQEKRKALEVKVEEDRPKTTFADAVSTSKTSILIGDLAKLICQNGVQIGQKRLFEWMRQNGYLIKSGSSKNMPTQRSLEMGLFEIKESTFQSPDGSVRITKTSKCTGRGQIYFVNKFLGRGIAE